MQAAQSKEEDTTRVIASTLHQCISTLLKKHHASSFIKPFTRDVLLVADGIRSAVLLDFSLPLTVLPALITDIRHIYNKADDLTFLVILQRHNHDHDTHTYTDRDTEAEADTAIFLIHRQVLTHLHTQHRQLQYQNIQLINIDPLPHVQHRSKKKTPYLCDEQERLSVLQPLDQWMHAVVQYLTMHPQCSVLTISTDRAVSHDTPHFTPHLCVSAASSTVSLPTLCGLLLSYPVLYTFSTPSIPHTNALSGEILRVYSVHIHLSSSILAEASLIRTLFGSKVQVLSFSVPDTLSTLTPIQACLSVWKQQLHRRLAHLHSRLQQQSLASSSSLIPSCQTNLQFCVSFLPLELYLGPHNLSLLSQVNHQFNLQTKKWNVKNALLKSLMSATMRQQMIEQITQLKEKRNGLSSTDCVAVDDRLYELLEKLSDTQQPPPNNEALQQICNEVEELVFGCGASLMYGRKRTSRKASAALLFRHRLWCRLLSFQRFERAGENGVDERQVTVYTKTIKEATRGDDETFTLLVRCFKSFLLSNPRALCTDTCNGGGDWRGLTSWVFSSFVCRSDTDESNAHDHLPLFILKSELKERVLLIADLFRLLQEQLPNKQRSLIWREMEISVVSSRVNHVSV